MSGSAIAAKQCCTRTGRELAERGGVNDAKDADEVQRLFHETLAGDPALSRATDVIGEDEALRRFAQGVRRGAGVDLRRREGLWSHELVAVTIRVPPDLRRRFDRVPGQRLEDRLRALVELWEQRQRR